MAGRRADYQGSLQPGMRLGMLPFAIVLPVRESRMRPGAFGGRGTLTGGNAGPLRLCCHDNMDSAETTSIPPGRRSLPGLTDRLL